MARAQGLVSELKYDTKKLPPVHDKKQVGKYDVWWAGTGGYRYDRVLEYRVWYRKQGAPAPSIRACADYETAKSLAAKLEVAGQCLYLHLVVLVEQDYYFEDTPDEEDHYRIDQKRSVEWEIEWLLEPQEKPPGYLVCWVYWSYHSTQPTKISMVTIQKIKVLNQHFFTLGGRGPGPQKKIKKSDEHIQIPGIAQHFFGEQKKVLPNTKSYEATIFLVTLYDYLYERDVTHTNF
jgi:hypothetical protein